MIHTRYLLVFLILSTLLMGCDVTKSAKDQALFKKIDDIHTQVKNEEWDDALDNVDKWEDTYEKRLWKMQLLGEQADYEGINLEITLLKERLKRQNERQAIDSIIQLKHYLSAIYDF
ncbi:DUF4363 family protein [Caldalkalibacillus salinus]|uniref:DUF4363 family protein n=1 Tax=Caldalkalibacillus salinus TaxID=2803787 RepID=UPI001F2988D2|nr:DUF4363 family protein [Caldalkalibacillus salinus]